MKILTRRPSVAFQWRKMNSEGGGHTYFASYTPVHYTVFKGKVITGEGRRRYINFKTPNRIILRRF